MKKFNLILLQDRKSIGYILLSENYGEIAVEFEDTYKKDYEPSVTRLVEGINIQGGFGVNLEKGKLKIQGGSREFWLALKQDLISKLGMATRLS